MLPVLLAAFLLGIVAGLRTFTAPAVLWLIRHQGPVAILLAVAAVIEFGGDLYPKAPPRTRLVGLMARLISGAFVGWWIAASHGGSAIAGVVAGIIGALIGAYGGYTIRIAAIEAIGAIPGALIEDAVAIALAVLVVTHA